MFDPEPVKSSFEPNLLIEFVRPPFRRLEFSTPIGPARVAAVLRKIVEPSEMFRSPFSKKHRYFEGSVDGDHFKISRITNYYRNSFLPIIEGSFRPDLSGTIVSLNLRMAWPVTMLWVVMILLPLLSFVANGSQAWVRGPGTFLIKMTLFFYFMASIGFAIEARIAMKTLRRLLRFGGTR
jgi:hypothetical protein